MKNNKQLLLFDDNIGIKEKPYLVSYQTLRTYIKVFDTLVEGFALFKCTKYNEEFIGYKDEEGYTIKRNSIV